MATVPWTIQLPFASQLGWERPLVFPIVFFSLRPALRKAEPGTSRRALLRDNEGVSPSCARVSSSIRHSDLSVHCCYLVTHIMFLGWVGELLFTVPDNQPPGTKALYICIKVKDLWCWRNASGVKSSHCSYRGPVCTPTTISCGTAYHSCPTESKFLFWPQWSWNSLAQIHTERHTHIYIISKDKKKTKGLHPKAIWFVLYKYSDFSRFSDTQR